MKVIVPLSPPGGGLDGVAELAADIEASGFDGLASNETSSDPLLPLALAAGATARVTLMTSVAVAFGRSPMLLASQATAVHEFSGGRLVLGLGSQVKAHIERRFSMPWSAPAARMAEYVEALRAIWHAWATGEPLNFRGEFYTHTIMSPVFTPTVTRPAPAVYLAGVGPLMTRAAGRVADGFIMHPFTTQRYAQAVTLPALAAGRGSATSAFDVVNCGFIVTGRTAEELASSRQAVCEQLAFYASTPVYHGVLEFHGWSELGRELNELARSDRPDRWSVMGTLIDDDVLDAFAIVGEPDEVGAKLVDRWGDCCSIYKMSPIGWPDPALQRQVAQAIQTSSAQAIRTSSAPAASTSVGVSAGEAR
jgi:probable F420-dependent oxidoreductase